MDKIETIRSKFPEKVQNIPQVQKTEIRSKMNVFERASENEIKKPIFSSSSKSCDLDPIPTSVLKNCLDILIAPITDIINILMETSTFFRKINNIDYESFHSDIFSSDLIKKPEKYLSALCQQYDSFLSSILDKHAPVSTKTLPGKPPTPWMTPEIMKAKTLRHNLERTWRRSHTHLDRSRYKQQCHLCNRMMTKAK